MAANGENELESKASLLCFLRLRPWGGRRKVSQSPKDVINVVTLRDLTRSS